ncbi:MAG: type II secretion system F family protein [Gammaproteobacteria bacterium]|nr:type II secretion system F family protein [Gammaproteobacteria bacterium]
MEERFHYKGFDAAGSGVDGTVDAADLEKARLELRERDILVTEIRAAAETRDWRESLGLSQSEVGLGELEIITAELALLLENGVRIDRGLEILRRGASNPASRRLLDALLQSLKQGNQLSTAAAEWPQVFDPLYVNLLSLGEASGRLSAVFRRLADDLGFRRDLRRKIISAVTYPLVILAVCVVALLFIFNFVVPNLATLFADYPDLPWYTKALMGVSDFMQRYQLLLGAILVALAVVASYLPRWPALQLAWQEFSANAPGLSAGISMVERIRLTGGMAMMLESGVPVDRALQLASGSVKSAPIKRELSVALMKLRQGEGISTVLRQTRLFPDFYASLLEVGEESGALAPVFDEIAKRSRQGFADWTQRFTSLLEPALILFMGIMVGAVVVVIMLSITSITGAAL